ncbi:MAG TPA: FGGY family carbohydrate kinase [Dinghuibacter sp.]|uniref:FGGY-family carbohydrate kinase n=1 Tax=Dinghuibacter sp. TaxID=2024697 RepID=UPI002B93489E|nr:FGGY family carbohydrate kinase [Dinghuibacter sp.]HTJ12376.1 FGGY family carbohydrate kinase [Dinghuibacter sp.]
MEAYLIIDIGTGNARAAVVSPEGTLLGVAREDIVYHQDPLYPEALYFDPAMLWEQIERIAAAALSQAGPATILAVTSTSQREGIVLLDGLGNSLIGLPNIDHRGRQWEHLLTDKSRVYALTGRYPTSLFSAFKLHGVRERRDDLWRRLHTVTSISDWIGYKLSGVVRYEHSQASETLLYNVARKDWSDELCSAFDISAELLPPLADAGTVLGPVSAGALGLSPQTSVVVGGGDTQLAIMSTHPETGDVVIVSGTTTPVNKIAGDYITDRGQRTWTGRHTDKETFMLEANAGVTGLNYQRLKEIFYPNETYAVIERELGQITRFPCVASLGSVLADEKTPLTKGGFIFDTPVSHQLTRAAFVWATLWDIACSVYENYKTLDCVSPHNKPYVWACGGGMESPTLRRFLAGLTGKQIRMRLNYRQASAAGGALLCNSALGRPVAAAGDAGVVTAVPDDDYGAWYDEWKKTRQLFTA